STLAALGRGRAATSVRRWSCYHVTPGSWATTRTGPGRWDRRGRTIWGCSTCTATSGPGARTATKNIRRERGTGQPGTKRTEDPSLSASTACCVARRSPITRRALALPTVSSGGRATASTRLACAWRVPCRRAETWGGNSCTAALLGPQPDDRIILVVG